MRASDDFFLAMSVLGPVAFAIATMIPDPRLGPFAQSGAAAGLGLLPLGSYAARGALLEAVLLGCLGAVLYRAADALFVRQGGHSRLDPWLALAAAWLVCFSEAALGVRESSGAGLLWILLAQVLLLVSIRTPRFGLAKTLVLTGLGGFVFGREPVLGGVVVLAALLRLRTRGVVSSLFALGTFAGVACVARLNASEGAFGFIHATFLPAEGTRWLFGVSPVLGLFALVSLVVLGLALPTVRSLQGVLPLLAVVVLGALGYRSASLELAQATALLGATAIVLLGLLGVRALAEGALAMDLFGARSLSLLAVVLTFALALGEFDRTESRLGLRDTLLLRDATDLLLERVPDGSLLLVRDPDLLSRLRTAQLHHERPDLRVVGEGDLFDSSRLRALLREEPALLTLVREWNVNGAPTEEALSLLADQRPVFVEPAVDWEPRLLAHLEPGFFLARFRAHPVARSDRQRLLVELAPRSTALAGRLAGEGPEVALVLRTQALLAAGLRTAGDEESAAQTFALVLPRDSSSSDAKAPLASVALAPSLR